jgi:hypothetical protein
MTSLLSRIVRPIKRKASIPPVLASGVHFAVGRPARKIAGFVTADTNGTRSTPGASALPASTSGLRPSASHAPAGRCIRVGMLNEKRKLSFLFRDLPARHPELDYPVTVGDYVRMMSKHGPNHLEQIERLKKEAAGK